LTAEIRDVSGMQRQGGRRKELGSIGKIQAKPPQKHHKTCDYPAVIFPISPTKTAKTETPH
jgi:hypothetical protein